MASLNDLINVQFVDAVTHDIVDTSDVLGVIMPYHWGPAGKVNVFDSQSFYEAYPEAKNGVVNVTDAYNTYYQIKSYFANGGSKVAVYRPTDTQYGNPTEIITGKYLAFKYNGLPCISGDLTLVVSGPTGGNYEVKFKVGSTVVESFEGQLTDAEGTDEGESTYLPTILANKSQYMQIVGMAPTGIRTAKWIATGIVLKAEAEYTGDPVAAEDLVEGTTYYKAADTPAVVNTDYGFPGTYTPSRSEELHLDDAFATGDTIEGGATQFIEYNALVDAYQSATFFIPIAGESWSSSNNKFVLDIEGTEKIKCFGTYHGINCNAGVAGAYAKVAQNNNLNQVASARTYGAYIGNITSSKSFTSVLTDANIGKITVFNAPSGPQIFGVRNSYASSKAGSYFSKANVTRVLAALLRNIKPLCLDAIHTQTAADAILRSQFETRLNNVMNTFIGNRDLQPDSIAICNASNNSDAQTLGGQILNVILKCHFIGLVEMVNIKVVATDSSVTTEIV